MLLYFALRYVCVYVQLVLAGVGDAALAGAALCWKTNLLLEHSPQLLLQLRGQEQGQGQGQGQGSPARVLQWEDGLLALQAAVQGVEEAVLEQLLPRLLAVTAQTQTQTQRGAADADTDADADRDAAALLAALRVGLGALRAALARGDGRLDACLSLSLSAEGPAEQQLQRQLGEVDLALCLDRALCVSGGLAAAPAGASSPAASAAGSASGPGSEDEEGGDSPPSPAPPSAEWFVSAITNIIGRLQKHSGGAGVWGGGAAHALLREMDGLLAAAAPALEEVAAGALTALVSASAAGSGQEQEQEQPGRVAALALGRAYASLQDASSVFFAHSEPAPAAAGSQAVAAVSAGELTSTKPLLNSGGLWARLQSVAAEAGAGAGAGAAGPPQSSSWRQRAGAIRERFLSLSEADARLAAALRRAEERGRESSALGEELRAARSRLAESLAVQAAHTADAASDAKRDAIKKENEVLD
jgi:hypothetical protein